MKIINFFLIILLLLVQGNNANAQKKLGEINSMPDLAETITSIKIKYNTSNILWVFDIDNTLMVTNENGFGSDKWVTNAERYLNVVSNETSQTLHPSNIKILSKTIFDELQYDVGKSEPKRTLIDTNGIGAQEIIINSIKKGRTMALTSRGKDPKMKELTYESLKNIKYKFVDSIYPTKKPILPENPTIFKNIIFTQGGNKGKALLEYIENYYPDVNVVVFMDDSKEKIADVANTINNIPSSIKLHNQIILKTYWMNIEKTFRNRYYTEKERNKLTPEGKLDKYTISN